jgi:hypothetical protein
VEYRGDGTGGFLARIINTNNVTQVYNYWNGQRMLLDKPLFIDKVTNLGQKVLR